MNNVVMRKVVVTDQFAPLSAESLVASVEISTVPGNSSPVIFKGDDGSEVPWIPGEFHSLNRVDLKEIEIKGLPGDVVTIVGGTW